MGVAREKVTSGNWYAVPLQGDAIYAVGVVTHIGHSHRDLLMGYFFGPVRSNIPMLADVVTSRPADAILIAKFGFGNIHWPLLGRDPDWQSELWPIPAFGRVMDPPGIGVRMVYSNNDPYGIFVETRVSIEEALSLPSDSFFGSIAVEIVLTKLLLGPTAVQSKQDTHEAASHDFIEVTHYAYFNSAEDAETSQRIFAQAGYLVEVDSYAEPEVDAPYWEVHIYERIPYGDETAFETAVEKVESMVEQHSGDYDGYDRTMRPKP
jgi:hypothetical protein